MIVTKSTGGRAFIVLSFYSWRKNNDFKYKKQRI